MTAALKAEVSDKANDFRKLVYLMESLEFDEAWKKDPDNIWVRFAIINGNVEEIRKWMKETVTQEVGEMSLRQLRARASQLGIARVTIYTKDELIVKIIQVQDARKAQNTAS